ncbi:hypothetical protein M433DRAFT_470501 [Acidomyces richmondensis BFW]|nr:MAG: hypothetical protein FE78DRAFT_271834 [Acidomyces sp. 'richmondensis']KYG47790.1 hypothetical protein M433DRAFT_470501 [Acidomyces richmondensis BFW]
MSCETKCLILLSLSHDGLSTTAYAATAEWPNLGISSALGRGGRRKTTNGHVTGAERLRVMRAIMIRLHVLRWTRGAQATPTADPSRISQRDNDEATCLLRAEANNSWGDVPNASTHLAKPPELPLARGRSGLVHGPGWPLARSHGRRTSRAAARSNCIALLCGQQRSCHRAAKSNAPPFPPQRPKPAVPSHRSCLRRVEEVRSLRQRGSMHDFALAASG